MQILDFTEGVEGEEAAVAEAEAAEEEVCPTLSFLRAYKSPCSRPPLLTQSVLLPDLNKLYQKVIFRNNRLEALRMIDLSCTDHDMAQVVVAVPSCTSCTRSSCAHGACCAL